MIKTSNHKKYLFKFFLTPKNQEMQEAQMKAIAQVLAGVEPEKRQILLCRS